jgi:hypothetical protein
MGAKRTSRLFAVLIAVMMIATSAVGVFADGSPVNGAISGGSVYATSQTAGVATWSPKKNADSYNVYVNDVLVESNVKTTSVNLQLKKKNHYVIKVEAVNKSGETSERTTIGKLCTYKKITKVKVKKAGKKKIKVSWKKNKYKVTGFKIAVYENGKYKKTVSAGKKASSKTIKKLKSGAKYKFVVYPVCKDEYRGVQKTSKTVKCK